MKKFLTLSLFVFGCGGTTGYVPPETNDAGPNYNKHPSTFGPNCTDESVAMKWDFVNEGGVTNHLCRNAVRTICDGQFASQTPMVPAMNENLIGTACGNGGAYQCVVSSGLPLVIPGELALVKCVSESDAGNQDAGPYNDASTNNEAGTATDASVFDAEIVEAEAIESSVDSSNQLNCNPGNAQCNGTVLETCDTSGNWNQQDCNNGTTNVCVNGQCLSQINGVTLPIYVLEQCTLLPGNLINGSCPTTQSTTFVSSDTIYTGNFLPTLTNATQVNYWSGYDGEEYFSVSEQSGKTVWNWGTSYTCLWDQVCYFSHTITWDNYLVTGNSMWITTYPSGLGTCQYQCQVSTAQK